VRYLPIGLIIGLVLFCELIFVLGSGAITVQLGQAIASPTPDVAQMGNTQALGTILYTHYFYLFQASGLVLLVAMIGAIVLTHREREGVKRQKIANQVARGRDSVAVVKVQSGSGV
jgi:NADH-quinone oxidoreductase subunit J